MSKDLEKVSEKAPEEPQKSSVYDFLYCDNRRIGSFLSQFDESGQLEKVIQTAAATKVAQRGSKWSVGGGATVLGTGGTGSLGFERSPGDQGTESLQRVYDPLWTNAITLLDFLEGASLIERDIHNAQIGRFTLSAGKIIILDLTSLGGMYTNPAISSLIKSSLPLQLHTQLNEVKLTNKGSRNQKNEPYSIADMMIYFMSVLPHSVQIRMSGFDFNVWAATPAENLIGSPSDLILKHGTLIAGEWQILGILDARPEGPNHVVQAIPDEATALLADSPVGTLAAGLGPMARFMMGRPPTAFGITPLLIFREVSG